MNENLEPPDPIEAACTECGEEENIDHVDGPIWKCLLCDDNFSDGSDDDESNFHEH
jgi:ribosomal protein L37AE/L43A